MHLFKFMFFFFAYFYTFDVIFWNFFCAVSCAKLSEVKKINFYNVCTAVGVLLTAASATLDLTTGCPGLRGERRRDKVAGELRIAGEMEWESGPSHICPKLVTTCSLLWCLSLEWALPLPKTPQESCSISPIHSLTEQGLHLLGLVVRFPRRVASHTRPQVVRAQCQGGDKHMEQVCRHCVSTWQ